MKEFNIIVEKKIKITQEDIDDIMDSALSGITYLCNKAEVVGDLIMFHDVKLVYEDTVCKTMNCSMQVLNELVAVYKGYQMHAVLKKTIEANNFDLAASIKAHK